MSQNIFKNPFVSSAPTLTGGSVGNGTLTVDRLTHFTIDQSYSAVCTAISPFTVFKIIGSLDGAVGVAVVGTQFFDQDLKLFLTINQGPTTFQIADTFEFTLSQGVDLNRENIDLYDELPQKNFGPGVVGSLSGDYNIRLNTSGIDSFRVIQDLKFTSKISGAEGNEISIEYIAGSVLTSASLVIDDITYTASPGPSGNDISILYTQFTPAIAANKIVQDLNWIADIPGLVGNNIGIVYIAGATAGSESVGVTGSGTLGSPYIITVTIEDGVSTVDQIRLAVGLDPIAGPLVDGNAIGTGFEVQSIQSQILLDNGSDAIGAAGSEVVNINSLEIEIIIEDGVSTAQNIRDAVFASGSALALVTPTITGTAATTQNAPFAPTNLSNGAADVGLPGAEIVSVLDKAIKVTFNNGLSTALQLKTAIDSSIAANALVDVLINGVGSNFEIAPVNRTFLRAGQLSGTYSFNSEELTLPGAFFEGNADLLANNLNLQGLFNVEGESDFRGKVRLDDSIPGNNSSFPLDNVQKTINDLIGSDKAYLFSDGATKTEWSKPANSLVLNSDIHLFLPDLGIKNIISQVNSPISISDGESIYVTIDRLTSDAILPITITSGVIPPGSDTLRLVSRVGTSLVWWDNTLQREGKKIRIGEGGSAGAFQEKIGQGNGVTTSFGPMTLFPIAQEAIIVWSNVNQFMTTDWSFNQISNTIDFVSAPALGSEIYVFYLTDGDTITPPSPSGVEQVLYFTLGASQILAKQLTLPVAPALVNKTIVDVLEGSSQEYSLDFTVSGTILTWSGLGLELDLTVGDKLRVKYFS